MLSQLARSLPLMLLCLAVAALPGCATQSAVSPHTPDDSASRHAPGNAAAQVAVRQVGVPYRYGGSGVDGFDCSGLVHYAYAIAGKAVPRTTAALWQHATPVATSDMRPGDVLFFNIDGKMSHVGLYLGDQRFVHAPSTGRTVTIARLDAEFYRQAFIRAGRP